MEGQSSNTPIPGITVVKGNLGVRDESEVTVKDIPHQKNCACFRCVLKKSPQIIKLQRTIEDIERHTTGSVMVIQSDIDDLREKTDKLKVDIKEAVYEIGLFTGKQIGELMGEISALKAQIALLSKKEVNKE